MRYVYVADKIVEKYYHFEIVKGGTSGTRKAIWYLLDTRFHDNVLVMSGDLELVKGVFRLECDLLEQDKFD